MLERSVETVRATIAGLRAEHLEHGASGRGWDFDGFRVWIDSNSPTLLAELDRYFAPFRRLAAGSLAEARAAGTVTHIGAIELAPEQLGAGFGAGRELAFGEYKPSVRGPKEAYFDAIDGRVVHKVRTGMWFLFGRDDHLAVGPCEANPNQVINFVNNRMIQWALHRGALLGHASAVCHAQGSGLPRAIAIAGFSGMGKSTLALHLMNDRRLDFASNDRVMIHAGSGATPELEGVPKHPRINPGTILHNPDLAGILTPEQRDTFAALEPDDLWQLEHKFDGLIHECYPKQRFFLRAEFVGLVLLNWSRAVDAGPTRAARIDVDERRELLPALIKEPGLFYHPGPGESATRDADRYVEFLANVPVLELSGTVDFDYGRAAALELLGLTAGS